MLRLGLYFLIRSISYTRQSIFPWHFLRTAKFLAKSRDLGLVSWSCGRCLQMDEELRQCSSILWKRCRVVWPMYSASHRGHEILKTTLCWLIREGFCSFTLSASPSLRLVQMGCRGVPILLLRLLSCFLKTSADFWSLNGSGIHVGCSTGTTGGLEIFDSLDVMKDECHRNVEISPR